MCRFSRLLGASRLMCPPKFIGINLKKQNKTGVWNFIKIFTRIFYLFFGKHRHFSPQPLSQTCFSWVLYFNEWNCHPASSSKNLKLCFDFFLSLLHPHLLRFNSYSFYFYRTSCLLFYFQSENQQNYWNSLLTQLPIFEFFF